MATVKEDRRYAESHEWVKLDGDIATVGITDYAQHARMLGVIGDSYCGDVTIKFYPLV